MALDVDLLLDRRRLKRRLTIWRVLAIVAVVIAVLVGLHGAGLSGAGAHIARLPVNGIITEDPKLLRAIRAAAKDNNVKALIVSIDSPAPAENRCIAPSNRSRRRNQWSRSWAGWRPRPAI
jgi:protease-4